MKPVVVVPQTSSFVSESGCTLWHKEQEILYRGYGGMRVVTP